MINQLLDLAALRASYGAIRAVRVPNFLDSHAADSIYNFLSHRMPEDWWWRSTLINSAEYPEKIDLRRFACNLTRIEYLASLASRSCAEGTFSYVFDRSIRDHHERCRCVMCQLSGFFNTQLMEVVIEITDANLSIVRETFAARYTAGCFLAPHVDALQGRVGFVLNLTREWRPEFGGNLHITDTGGRKVVDLIVPEFNSLYVFDIPHGTGVPHFVSYVAPGVREKRLALTGWYE